MEMPPSPARSRQPGSLSPAAVLVRAHDRDRYHTALFAPAARREALFALYAFNYEIARIRETVTQPMLGRIRLQWWREVIAAACDGSAPRQHEIATPLTAVIRDRGLSRAYLDRLIDAREADLADEPPANLAALEDYAEGSAAMLFYLALEVLDAAAPVALAAARELGIAYALAGLLRAMPFHAGAGRSVIPVEIAVRTGLDKQDRAARYGSPALRAAVGELAASAQRHLRNARENGSAMPRGARPVLLSAVIAGRFLRRLAQAGHDPFAPALATPDTMQSWRLAAAALVGRW